MNRKNIENISIICLITIFMGQIYLSPVSDNFRFSMAVVALPLLLLYFKDTSIILSTSVIAVMMFLFRTFIESISHPEFALFDAVMQYLPVIIYYVLYGFLFKAFKIREITDGTVRLILALWVCDSTGNIAEAILRSIWKGIELEKAVLITIIIGLSRALFTYIIIKMIKQYQTRFERNQREEKFKELMLFTAKLKSELFFLKKSMHDIEATMNDSYTLYNKLQDAELKDHALNVSKNIHEIKKDYYRVVLGMEKTLEDDKTKINLSMKELLSIIYDSTLKLIATQHKNIALDFDVQSNFTVHEYYPLITILNNMIVNALDAIESHGKIRIQVTASESNCVIDVFDNGSGIPADELDLIFKPGYSTKFDSTSGKLSTGLGLSHVQYILNEFYDGHIDVTSYLNEYTNFRLTIPLNKLERI